MVEIAAPGQGITAVELAQATRNRGMPLEALRHDLTPVGLHYLLVHFDIPALDVGSWRLRVVGTLAADRSAECPSTGSPPPSPPRPIALFSWQQRWRSWKRG